MGRDDILRPVRWNGGCVELVRFPPGVLSSPYSSAGAMSRATKLRDALVAAVAPLVDAPVDAMVIPDWTPEELNAGPRIGVRHVGRELGVVMGPDANTVLISVGVFGLAAVAQGYDVSREGYRQKELELADSFDDLWEEVFHLFSPSGPLANQYFADHRLTAASQDQAFDVTHYHENGVWASALDLTYFDTLDE